MSKCIRKEPCIKCGSSDARQVFRKDTGGEDSYCFSCLSYGRASSNHSGFKPMNTKLKKEEVLSFPDRPDGLRGIEATVAKHYGHKCSINEITGAVDTIYYPRHIKGELAGYSVRVLPKDFESVGTIGNVKSADLVGAHLCSDASKVLIITEGDEDQLAIAQALWNHYGRKRFPNVVSVPSGVMSVKESSLYEKYEKIYICLDNDDAGQAAVQKLVKVLPVHRAYVMTLPYKDASEALQEGDANSIVDSFLNAQTYTPPSILPVAGVWDKLMMEDEQNVTRFPDTWELLNKNLGGLHLGSLDVWTSGTGMGKTQFMREMIVNLRTEWDARVGILSLEETVKDTMNGLIGVMMNKRLNLPEVRKSVPMDEYRKTFEKLSADDKLFIYDTEQEHKTEDYILSALTYLCEVKQCSHIFIDHLRMIEPAKNKKYFSELDRYEQLMTSLKGLTVKYRVWLGLVVHLRKSNSGMMSFERGALPSEDDLKGTGAIKQLSNTVLAIQRNKGHSNPEMRKVVQVHILKNRLTGETGGQDFFKYDSNTGRLSVIKEPFESIYERESVELL